VWQPSTVINQPALQQLLEARQSRRVGYYFEALLHFWLREIQGVEVVEHTRQIIEDGVTKGEIDFIFRTAQQQLVHWEVAVKFYLKTQPPTLDGSHLIGPDPTDNFAAKHHRLFGRQLQLSQRLPLRVDLRQGLMKGRIFYHPSDTSPATAGQLLNPSHLRGTWLRQEEIDKLAHPQRRFCTLEKPFWLSDLQDCQTSLPFAEYARQLRQHFTRSAHPVLLAALECQDGQWNECQRIFVVPTHWPAAT